MDHKQSPYETTMTHCVQPAPVVVFQAMGNCPSCHVGFLQPQMTCLGILCCILFFPLGIICLLLIQDQVCSHCGYTTS